MREKRDRFSAAIDAGELRADVARLPSPVGDDEVENLAVLSRTKILHLGRARVARAKTESEKAQRDIGRGSDG